MPRVWVQREGGREGGRVMLWDNVIILYADKICVCIFGLCGRVDGWVSWWGEGGGWSGYYYYYYSNYYIVLVAKAGGELLNRDRDRPFAVPPAPPLPAYCIFITRIYLKYYPQIHTHLRRDLKLSEEREWVRESLPLLLPGRIKVNK